jgi:hypothetical protein
MTAKRLLVPLPVAILATAAALSVAPGWAQTQAPAPVAKPLVSGDVLTGELTAIRKGSRKNRTLTFQVRSEPRRLPPPAGLCNLETGPETFEIVAKGDAETSQLKPFLGKTISVKASDITCSDKAGQLADAVVSRWSVVK